MPTPEGLAYLQHVGCHPTFGDVIAVFDDIDLTHFRFSILFPIGSAARRKMVTRLGRADIPQRFQKLIMRYPLGPLGQPTGWMIVDGEERHRTEVLTAEQKLYVLAFAVNLAKLEELISLGWTEGQPFPD
ncbi:hypothetical protein [Novosphingobium sp. PhB165]|uniref:hypothetical protein n=1 Tax=Novosphingobium sp. PhB165 TaxID=2485105 RepID=UPI00104F7D4A|nr:hypothetical protein [Novosphingobium sp. PhB165]